MKRSILIICLAIFGQISLFSQEQGIEKPKSKTDQTTLYNNVYVSYGGGSFYFSINQDREVSYSSTGTIMVGYHRTVNKVIGIGFQAAFVKIDRTEPTYGEPGYYYGGYSYEDNCWQALANIRFSYINKPMFCLYSGFGLGVTNDYYTETYSSNNTSYSGRKLLPAIQGTLLGFRVGRSLAAFGEFGMGTLQIINAGVSYKFGE
jgi:hypothetical protein